MANNIPKIDVIKHSTFISVELINLIDFNISFNQNTIRIL
jgi:hypothetical protein